MLNDNRLGHMMKTLRNLIVAICVLSTLSCDGGGDGGEVGWSTFVFRIHGLSGDEEFRFRTNNQSFIIKAREQLRLPDEQRLLFPIGTIASGNGGHNLNWSWHFTDLALAEASIELCDGRPSMVEANLTYWLDTVKSFCPWGGYIYAEL